MSMRIQPYPPGGCAGHFSDMGTTKFAGQCPGCLGDERDRARKALEEIKAKLYQLCMCGTEPCRQDTVKDLEGLSQIVERGLK